MPFSLKTIDLGTDRHGKPVTSCSVHHEDEIMAAKPGKAGRKPTCTPEEMLQYLPAASVTEWQRRVKEEAGLATTRFSLHKKHLEAGNRIRKTEKRTPTSVTPLITLTPLIQFVEFRKNGKKGRAGR